MKGKVLLTVLAGFVAAAPAFAAELSPKQIYQEAGPAVVLIMSFGADGRGELGTGSIIDKDGHILTNAHVVFPHGGDAPFETIHVYLKPKRLTGDTKKDLVDPKTARIVQADKGLDLALLEIQDKPENLRVLPIGDSDAVDAGEPVVAIGHPEQGGLWTLTKGVVSTVLADMGGVKGKDMFQTDASINRGNSGGPLINYEGAMVGVNSSMARKAADGIAITSVNFSLKSNVVKSWLASVASDVHYTAAAAPSEDASETGAGAGGKPAAAAASSPAAGASAPAPDKGPAAAPAAESAQEAPAEDKKPADLEEKPAEKGRAPAPKSEQAESAPAGGGSSADMSEGQNPSDKDKAKQAEAEISAEPKEKSPAETKADDSAAAKTDIVTPVKPFKIDDLISEKIQEMEDMEEEMHQEVEKRRDLLDSMKKQHP